MRRFAAILAFMMVASVAFAGEMTFQAWNYHMPGEREFYDDLIADFEAANPGDSVDFQFGEWDDAHDTIAAWLEAGEGPDLVVAPDMWLAEFADDLTPYVDDLSAEMKSEFFEVLLNKATWRGHTWGLVWATSTKALFYRTDLFEQAGIDGPPRDWDELLDYAQRLHRWDSPYGLGIPVKPVYESTDNWYFFFWSAGGEFFDENGKAAVNSPIGVASLKFYRDLARRHHVTQPEPTSWSRKETRKYFIAEKVAMHANGPWTVGDIISTNPDLPFAVAPLPVAPDRKPFDPTRATQVITDHLVMPVRCADRDLAMRFIRFAYQDRYRQRFCELGMVPEKKSVARSDFFQDDPAWRIFVEIIPDGKFIPLMKWEPIELAAQQMLYDVFTGRRSVESALDELAAVMDAEVAAQGRDG
ncbi:MAG: extracellular solute-binding protein [Armatimonadia bacterium]|nr:extracellular solute-binding protein [Armatimonadia bacterium]